MRASCSRSGRLRWFLPVLLLACGAYPGSAVASATKPYTLNLSPETVPAGTQAAFSATFSNPAAGQQQLGSANLAAPAGIVLRSASVAAPATVTVVGSTVRLRNLALQPGRSLTVTVVADVACNPAVVTWAVQAKQANDFQGPPGNDMTLAAPSSLTTTISGQCKLRFVTQPSNQRVGEPLTGTPYGPGPPVSVEIVDGAGARVTTQSAEVTIERGSGFGSGTLSGAKSVGTVLGVANFPDLALSAPGTYSLQASSAGLVPATSTTFRVDTVAAFCEDDVSCARSTSLGTTKLDVTALSAAGSPDAGFLDAVLQRGAEHRLRRLRGGLGRHRAGRLQLGQPDEAGHADLRQEGDGPHSEQRRRVPGALLRLAAAVPSPRRAACRCRRGASTGTATGRPSRSTPDCSRTAALTLRRA